MESEIFAPVTVGQIIRALPEEVVQEFHNDAVNPAINPDTNPAILNLGENNSFFVADRIMSEIARNRSVASLGHLVTGQCEFDAHLTATLPRHSKTIDWLRRRLGLTAQATVYIDIIAPNPPTTI